MTMKQCPVVFVQRLSICKTLSTELFMLAAAVLPLTPNASNGLRYTAFFYKMPFFIFLVAACAISGLIAAAFSVFVWRAVLRVPVLTITDLTITVLQMRERSVNKADVLKIVPIWPGNLNLEIRDERPLVLPLFFYEQPRLTLEQLQPIEARRAEGATQSVS